MPTSESATHLDCDGDQAAGAGIGKLEVAVAVPGQPGGGGADRHHGVLANSGVGIGRADDQQGLGRRNVCRMEGGVDGNGVWGGRAAGVQCNL